MRRLLVMSMTAAYLALAVSPGEPANLLLAGAAVIAIGVLLAVRVTTGVSGARELTVGARARQHRQQLGALPEPQHPDTDGRSRSRAPSRVVPATPPVVE
jgi:hypothetical protein